MITYYLLSSDIYDMLMLYLCDKVYNTFITEK